MVLQEFDIVRLAYGEIGVILDIMDEEDGAYMVEVFEDGDQSGVPLYWGVIYLTEMKAKIETIDGEQKEFPIDSKGKKQPSVSYRVDMKLHPA